jgi:hypothetical protein
MARGSARQWKPDFQLHAIGLRGILQAKPGVHDGNLGCGEQLCA